MKRETYIQLRKTNNMIAIVYNHYYEVCLEKGEALLDFSKFAEWFPRYIGNQHIENSVIEHYYNLYDVTLVQVINVDVTVTLDVL